MMNQTPYHLHAVMVHQGEASGGHYWAYTRKHPSLVIPPLKTTPEPPQSQDVGDRETASGGVLAWGKTKESEEAAGMGAAEGTTGFHTQLETGEIYADTTQSPEGMVAADESGGSANLSPPEPGGVAQKMEVERSGGAEDEEGAEREAGEDGGRKEWMKFNDVSVCEVDWEEVRRESVGSGSGNTSAYCLVYINRLLHQDWLQSGECGREGGRGGKGGVGGWVGVGGREGGGRTGGREGGTKGGWAGQREGGREAWRAGGKEGEGTCNR